MISEVRPGVGTGAVCMRSFAESTNFVELS